MKYGVLGYLHEQGKSNHHALNTSLWQFQTMKEGGSEAPFSNFPLGQLYTTMS